MPSYFRTISLSSGPNSSPFLEGGPGGSSPGASCVRADFSVRHRNQLSTPRVLDPSRELGAIGEKSGSAATISLPRPGISDHTPPVPLGPAMTSFETLPQDWLSVPEAASRRSGRGEPLGWRTFPGGKPWTSPGSGPLRHRHPPAVGQLGDGRVCGPARGSDRSPPDPPVSLKVVGQVMAGETARRGRWRPGRPSGS